MNDIELTPYCKEFSAAGRGTVLRRNGIWRGGGRLGEQGKGESSYS